jgi:hypothetical protein
MTFGVFKTPKVFLRTLIFFKIKVLAKALRRQGFTLLTFFASCLPTVGRPSAGRLPYFASVFFFPSLMPLFFLFGSLE